MSREKASGRTWIDVSLPLHRALAHWPGEIGFEILRAQDISRGDPVTVSVLRLGAHTGTHFDAPAHFLKQGDTIDRIPFEAVLGRARVIEVNGTRSISARDLRPYGIRRGERLLFKTSNSGRLARAKSFFQDYAHLALDAAELLAGREVRLVGIDSLSVAAFGADSAPTHRALLEAGVWILEGLDLSSVEPGRYEMVCLPLRIVGAEGAPARVALRAL